MNLCHSICFRCICPKRHQLPQALGAVGRTEDARKLVRRFWTQREAAAGAAGGDDEEDLGFDKGLPGLEALDWVRACNAVLTASVRMFAGKELAPSLELLHDMVRAAFPPLLLQWLSVGPGLGYRVQGPGCRVQRPLHGCNATQQGRQVIVLSRPACRRQGL